MSSDLDVLFPEVTVEAKGEQIKLNPFGFGQLSRVAKLCRPIADAMLKTGLLKITRNTENNSSTVTIDKDFVPKLFQLLDEAVEPLFVLIAYAIKKDRSWLDDLPIDQGISLTQQLYEINADFFVKRVIPLLGTKLSKFVSTGETSSQGSSVQGTDVKISTDTP